MGKRTTSDRAQRSADAKARDRIVRELARTHLDVETLDVRGRDHLDFSSQSVIGIRRALEAAFEAGRASVVSGRVPTTPAAILQKVCSEVLP